MHGLFLQYVHLHYTYVHNYMHACFVVIGYVNALLPFLSFHFVF